MNAVGPRRLLSALIRMAGDRTGNVAILFAVAMLVLIACTAFAVDEGALYLQRRAAQGAVDLAAIAAAADPENAEAVARSTLARNGFLPPPPAGDRDDLPRLVVETGGYTPDRSLPVSRRFAPGGTSPDAVRLDFHERGRIYFAHLWSEPPVIGVTAVASAAREASFSIGSGLAAVDGGLLNALLGQILGTEIDLSAITYRHLLGADVSVFGFLDALADELDIEAGTYQDVLSASASRSEIVRAIANTLSGSDQLAAMALAASLGPDGSLPIGRLFDLGDLGRLAIGTGAESGYSASVSVLGLLTAATALSDGTHEANLDLATGIPGVADFSVRLAIGEPPQSGAWFAIGSQDARVSTAQLRLALLLKLAGGAALGGASVRVPLYLSLADSEARVASVDCPASGGSQGSATIDVLPGIARLVLGQPSENFADFGKEPSLDPARLIATPLLRVTATGDAEMGNTEPIPLAFSPEEIAGDVIKTATADDYTRSLAQSLVDHMRIEVMALGIGLPTRQLVSRAVRDLITPTTPAIDAAIGALAQTVGLSLGQADLRVYRAGCRHAVLVQ